MKILVIQLKRIRARNFKNNYDLTNSNKMKKIIINKSYKIIFFKLIKILSLI